jgi:iron complex outermembrane receptor protein
MPIPAMMGHDDLGSVGFNFYGTYLISGGLVGADCAGLFGPECQTVDPKWRHTFQMTWNTPWNILARLQWRYISGTTLDENSTQPGLATGHFNAADASMPAVSYLDLSGAWRVTSNLTIRGGINNILDTDPPIISQGITGTGAPNAYPTYDLLGRVLFLQGTVKF